MMDLNDFSKALAGRYCYRASIIRVIDGDTVVARIDLGFNVFAQQTIRLYGIDAPEIRGTSKAKGEASKKHLESLLFAGPLTLYTLKDRTGKYGRCLGIFVAHGCEVSVNQGMIDAGHAVAR